MNATAYGGAVHARRCDGGLGWRGNGRQTERRRAVPRPLRYGCEFTIRATQEERDRLQQRARAAGLSLSRYVVEAGLTTEVPGPEERPLRERALFHVRKIGVNLNQIAHKFNGEAVVPPAELRAALEATTQALGRLAEKAGEGT